eukprot:Hpha_TRINITY_DN35036_c0_g1::TRINITY_DN35036_c0_g1_i1::g.82731::m.82731
MNMSPGRSGMSPYDRASELSARIQLLERQVELERPTLERLLFEIGELRITEPAAVHTLQARAARSPAPPPPYAHPIRAAHADPHGSPATRAEMLLGNLRDEVDRLAMSQSGAAPGPTAEYEGAPASPATAPAPPRTTFPF